MLPPHDVWHLDTLLIGRRVCVFPAVASTNTVALSLADDPANDGLAILTQEQTQGQGQHGRTWTAPPGSSVLLSLLLFPPPALRRPALLTAWAAVSVCETIRELAGLEPRIKWPNDVLAEGRKVCGILSVQRTAAQAESMPAVVVGIGLNVTQSADHFQEAGLPLAGSLASLTGKALAPRLVAERLIAELDDQYDRLLQGDLTPLEVHWKKRLALVGKQVLFETAQDKQMGRLVDITWDGVFFERGGEMVRVQPEFVRHLEEAL